MGKTIIKKDGIEKLIIEEDGTVHIIVDDINKITFDKNRKLFFDKD